MKTSFGYRTFSVFNYLFMFFMMIITLYPLLFVLFASLSESGALMAHSGLLLKPIRPNLEAYYMVFKNPNIISGYKNTLFVLTTGLSMNLILTIVSAYVLSKKGLPGRRSMMFFVILTMYFSGGMIPTYLTVMDLKLNDTLWALTVPTAISAYNLIIMRTAFEGIPASLEESAKIDGANHLVILFRIMMPLALPTFAVIALYYAVGHWNSWFSAMIYLRSRSRFPIQLILREVLIQGDTNAMTTGVSSLDQVSVSETVKYAVIVVVTLPILMIYPYLQKYFVKGVMIGAVKG